MDPRDKTFKIPREKIRRLIPEMGGCLASDRVVVDGLKVGFMYREKPDNDEDSGWRFFSGDETQDYAENPDNFALYEVNTICNYDSAVIQFMDSPYGTAFSRIPGSDLFEPENWEASEK